MALGNCYALGRMTGLACSRSVSRLKVLSDIRRCTPHGPYSVAWPVKKTKHFPLASVDCNALCSELHTVLINYLDLYSCPAIEQRPTLDER